MLSKNIVQAALLSLVLASYSLFGQQAWASWIATFGEPAGALGSTALGYFIVIAFAMLLNFMVTRNMGKQK